MNQTHYTIHGINGPVVKVTGGKGLAMMDMVSVGEEGLIGEVVSVDRSATTVQVYEDTAGLKPGQPVVSQGAPMSITLGPGMLTNIFDGIARPLKGIEAESGPFIGRGLNIPSLDQEKTWDVTLHVKAGDVLAPGALYASCPETPLIVHRCLVPAGVSGRVTKVVPAGAYRVSDTLVELTDDHGQIHPLALAQRWPIRTPRPIAQRLPIDRPLVTGQRIIDTLFPIGKGGAAAIPGPFGAGKTVLQHAISKQADADVIIMVACGERANEVVEIFKEFPELIDPHTGHTLMERTIIICNTSNMPVAAREASVYTGMTIGEYYRSMGLKVLVMADSTSRWAQALREMSNRLEELPGQDAFPMDLSAIISNFYSRAGLVKLVGGQTGSVTFLGTVSPAGGNLKEPVTESTKKAARCFYALSQGRADSKRYPAIDPLESYSKYLEYPEIREYLDEHIEKDWVDLVYAGKTIVQRGKEANDQINILGDDGVPVEYHERFWKSELIDFVILQQDAFDDIDANCPMERQQMMYKMVLGICNQEFAFADFEACSQFFKGLINLFRQMNYSEWKSEKFEGYRKQIEQYVSEQSK